MMAFQGRAAVFAILFVASMSFVFLAYLLNVGFAVLISLVVVLLVYLGTPLWRSSGDPQSRVRILALTLLASVTAPMLNSSWLPVALNRLIEFLNDKWQFAIPELTVGEIGPGQLTVYSIFAVCVVVVATKYPVSTIMKPKDPCTQLDQDKDFRDGFAKFIPLWAARLDGIDRELNWTDQDFVSLEAEVEMKSRRTWGRNVALLLDALRDIARTQSADRPVIILGEPGSGKSVALRRLCRTLLNESLRVGRLPVYINLKEWRTPSTWSSDTIPSTAELQTFIRNSVVSEANDFFAERFIGKYFDEMILEGRFFFIFDSFDEIPLIMDHPENSWAIDAASKCLNNFLQGAHASQGIVASRYFKKPSDALGAGTIFRIRPFDESRVREILGAVGEQGEAEVLEAFRSKAAVLRSATNPMIANLLASYVRERNGVWPDNTVELYRDYILRRIEDPIVAQRIKDFGIEGSDVLQDCATIASYMVDAESNTLNVTLRELQTIGESSSIAATVDILRYTRLGRLTSSEEPTFSFSHRRFQEFFVVSSMTSNQVTLALDAIQSDNRYRDILALYCEIASPDSMGCVASHSAGLLLSLNPESVHGDAEALRSAVQVLRFISDAFRTRSDLSMEFYAALERFVSPILNRRSGAKFNPLLAKFAAESLSVLPDFGTTSSLNQALKFPSQYVRETAFRASRHLVPTPEPLKKFVEHDIAQKRFQPISGVDLLRRYRGLVFSLNLSSGLKREKIILNGWVLDALLFPLSIIFLILSAPLLGVLYVYALSQVTRGHHPTEWLWGSRFISFLLVIFACFPVFLLAAAYLQYQGASWEQIQNSELFKQIIAFPLPPDLSRDSLAEIPSALSIPLVLFAILNIIFPLVPVTLSKIWELSHRERVVAKRKNENSKRITIGEIRESWRASREAVRQRRSVRPAQVTEPLTLRDYMSMFFLLVIVLAALTIALEIGIAAAGTFLALALFSLLFIRIFPFLLEKAKYIVTAAKSDAVILAKAKLSDRMHREKIEGILSSLRLKKNQLKFLEELSNRHVTVHGDWKDPQLYFKPDDAVTDRLVRLEERWLRLDD